jgi:hypothetical protein
MQACTIVAANYLAQARVLARSFRQHHPDAPFTILLVDELGDTDARIEEDGTQLLRLIDIGLDPGEEYRMPAIYNVTELSTCGEAVAAAPFAASRPCRSHLLRSGYRDLHAARRHQRSWRAHTRSCLRTMSLETIPRDKLRPTETDILGAGHVQSSASSPSAPRSADFLEWWSERLKREAIIAPARMRFTDQRWVDFVPSLFSHHLLRDRGCDVAYWNLHTRRLVWTGTRYEVDGERCASSISADLIRASRRC